MTTIFRRERVLLPAMFLLVFILLALRCFFGAEMTDEAYYVAQAHIQFAGPKGFFKVSSGYATVLAPLLWIYETLTGTREGIFLFSRLAFLVFKSGMVFGLWLLLKRRLPAFQSALFCLAVLTFSEFHILSFSYNALGKLCLLLGCAWAYGALGETGETRRRLFALMGGLSCGFAVYFHNVCVFTALFLLLPLFFFCLREKKGCSVPLFYMLGGALAAFLALLPAIVASGSLVSCFSWFIDSSLRSSNAANGVKASVGEFLRFFPETLLEGSLPALVLAVLSPAALLSGGLLRKRGKKALGCGLSVCGAAFLGASLILTCLLGYLNRYSDKFFVLGAWFALFLFLSSLRRPGVGELFAFFWLPWAVMLLAMVFFPSGSIVSRLHFAEYAALSLLLLPEEVYAALFFDPFPRVGHALGLGFTAVLCAVFLVESFFCPYNEVKLREMDAAVPSGIYRGIRTSSDRCERLLGIEALLSERLSGEDTVLFLDLAPFAYLMTDAAPFTPGAWDTAHYAPGVTEAAIYLKFFDRMGALPGWIVYIDKNGSSSREDTAYALTRLIEEHYVPEEAASSEELGVHFLVLQKGAIEP